MKEKKRKEMKITIFNNDYLQPISEEIDEKGEIYEDGISDFVTPENLVEPIVKRRRGRSKTVDLGSIVPSEEDEKIYGKRIRERMKRDEYFKKLSVKDQFQILKSEDMIHSSSLHLVPIRYRIINSQSLSNQTKQQLLHKIDYFETLTPEDNEYAKLSKWMHAIEKMPIDHLIHFPVSKSDPLPKIQSFMDECTSILNSTIYGQTRAKSKILELIAQRISNPTSVCSVIALTGPPGVGKTSLIKHGVSKALQYPFGFTALGGATDASFLEGHAYTYEGSHYGRIVEMLIETQCMNPILFFDELDKISDTAKGAEIAGILTHITDTTQNNSFHDKYLFGFDIDLSKCILFFSLNDLSLVNPILRDRLTIVEFDKYSVQDKIHISRNHLISSVCQNIGLRESDYLFTDEIIKYMIEKISSDEEGIRNLKRGFEKIFMKINYEQYMPDEKRMIRITNLPHTFTKEEIEKLLDVKANIHSSFSMIYL